MVPQGGKRKRDERNYSQDGGNGTGRPSPHRPGDLGMAHHDHSNNHQFNGYSQPPYHQQNQRGQYNYQYRQPQDGYRRGFRGGRGGMNTQSTPSRVNTDRVETSSAMTAQNTSERSMQSSNAFTEEVRPSTAPAAPSRPITPPASAAAIPRPAVETLAVQKEPSPQRVIQPFQFQHLTDERTRTWEESGRSQVFGEAERACEAADYVALSAIFIEVLRSALDSRLAPTEAATTVEKIISACTAYPTLDAATTFLDTVSILAEVENFQDAIKVVVLGSGISSELMREQLEESLLLSLGLIRSTFNRMFIRKQTNILYRQSNYNLLREETEGYSKLVTELFTTVNDGPPSEQVVTETFENVKALIGAFDLDAGRVLDVTLDVFASLLVKHYRFFVKMLRISSWWPQDEVDEENMRSNSYTFQSLPLWARPGHSSWVNSDADREEVEALKNKRNTWFWERARAAGTDAFFELGSRARLDDAEVAALLREIPGSDVSDQVALETRRWVEVTRTLPPAGNSTAAQLLGFKLRFYASQARDPTDTLPLNLIYLAALLIKVGFISLRDLYAHLEPADEGMEAVKEKQAKEKEERDLARRPGGGALNALARAGALVDDTIAPPVSVPVTARLRDPDTRATTPAKAENNAGKTDTSTTKPEEEDSEPLPEPLDQKVQLLRSLLCIGAIPEALYLLGRFPWLVDAFPDLPEHIHRICHYALSGVYEKLNPLADRNSVRDSARAPALDQSGAAKGAVRFMDKTTPKVLRWAQLDRNDTNDGIDYRFYWDDWTDAVPVCQSVDDVFVLCSTILNFSGYKIGNDPELMSKLARIGKHSLSLDTTGENVERWIGLCKRLLCPALSMTRANPAVVNEVYDVLKFFPTKTRYEIYTEWFTGATSRTPDISIAFDIVKLETKDTLRRINKTNQKLMARALAKIACSSPGTVFQVVLNQVEAYDNLTDVVVECGRYFTYMGYDVLTWSIMNALGRAGRSHKSADGINTNKWLSSLSTFCGKIFKRYAHMQSLPILQYVLNQLQNGNSADLRVLREIVSAMAGIATDTDFSESQVQAMAGGSLLQTQTLRQVQDKRHELKIPAKRLIRCLNDHDLTGSILISIAQERQRSQYNIEAASLKVISENFDEIHNVFIQYLDMLRSGLTVKDFNAVVPDTVSMISEYGLDPSIAFTIFRQSIAKAVEEYDAEHSPAKRRLSTEKSQPKDDIDMTDAVQSAELGKDDAEVQVTASEDVPDSITIEKQDTSVPVTADIKEEDTSLTVMTKPLTHWHPVMQDLMTGMKKALPADFEETMSLPFYVTFWQLSLHDMMAPSGSYDEEIKRQKDRVAAINNDRTDLSSAGTRKKEQEKKAINELLERLREEMVAHIHSYQHVRNRLQLEKDMWFKDHQGNALNVALLQSCFLPRCMISPLDSFFTQKMLFFLHSSGAPNFRTVQVFDRLLNEKAIANLIFNCTTREADNLGRFLNDVLKELTTWHADKAIYEKKAYGVKRDLAGFACNARLTPEGKPENLLLYEDFRRLFFKWHKNLYNAFRTCLNNGGYMHIKNAIVMLKCIHRCYPAVNFMGKGLMEILARIVKDEKTVRDDLFVAANSLKGMIGAREKEWVMPQAFHFNSKAAEQNAASASTSASTTAVLNATAPEFTPKDSSSAIADVASGKVDVEDGEVEDAQSTAISAEDVSQKPQKAASAGSSVKQQPAPTPTAAKDSSSELTTGTSSKNTAGEAAPAHESAHQAPRMPQRPDFNRQTSTPNTSGRGAHTLPDRPEVPGANRNAPQDRQAMRNLPTPTDRLPTSGRPQFDRSRLSQQSDITIKSGRLQPDVVPNRSGLHQSTYPGPTDHNDRSGRHSAFQANTDDRNNRYSDHDSVARTDNIRSSASAVQTDHYTQSSRQMGPPDIAGGPLGAINSERAALIQQSESSSRSPRPRRADGHSDAERSPARLDSRAHSGFVSSAAPGPVSRGHDYDGTGSGDSRRNAQDLRHESSARTSRPARHDAYESRERYAEEERSSNSRQTIERSDRSVFSRPPHDVSRSSRRQDENYGRLNNDTEVFDSRTDANPAGPRHAERGYESDRLAPQGRSSNVDMDGSGTVRSNGGSRSASRRQSPSRGAATVSTPLRDSNETVGIHPSRLNQVTSVDQVASGRVQSHNERIENSTPASAPLGPRSTQHRSYETPPVTSGPPVPSSRGPPTAPNNDRRRDQRRVGGSQDPSRQGSHQSSHSSHPATPSMPTNDRRGEEFGIRGIASVGAPGPDRSSNSGRHDASSAVESSARSDREGARRGPTSDMPARHGSSNAPAERYDSHGRRADYERHESSRHAPSREHASDRGGSSQKDRMSHAGGDYNDNTGRQDVLALPPRKGDERGERSERYDTRRSRDEHAAHSGTPFDDSRARDRGAAGHTSRNGYNEPRQEQFTQAPRHAEMGQGQGQGQGQSMDGRAPPRGYGGRGAYGGHGGQERRNDYGGQSGNGGSGGAREAPKRMWQDGSSGGYEHRDSKRLRRDGP